MTRAVDLPPPAQATSDGLLPGGWWHTREHDPERIVCDLCPRACSLRAGDRGFCFVRQNLGGELFLTTYGRSTGFCLDPIEKKPLNHFYPGSSVLSFGTAGCNLGCKFCQNWEISKSREIEQLSETASPAAIAEAALQHGARSVAFTYNDPVIWAEYAIDTARECRARGVKTVAVTAGYITPQARGPFYEFIDAANVDLKGFTEDFYQQLTLSHLEPVLDTLRWLRHESGVWLEITNLIIPEENDSRDELRRMCDWIVGELGPEVPTHFTAFHPDFRLRNRGHTPPETLLAAYDIARAAGMHYPYVGNVLAREQQSTRCAGCRQTVIERAGYEIGRWGLEVDAAGAGRCRSCGAAVAGRFDPGPGDWGSRRLPVRIADYAPAPLIDSATLLRRPPVIPQTSSSPTRSETTMSTSPTTDAASAADRPADPAPVKLDAGQQQALLAAAARSLAAAAAGRPTSDTPDLGEVGGAPVLGTFVTVRRQGRLRGCCGNIGAGLSLAESLTSSAARTAEEDPRFPALSPSELPYLDLDAWILSERREVKEKGAERAKGVTIGKHGLAVQRGNNAGLLLPSVAIEQKLDAEGFLAEVCRKAGLPAEAWQEDDAIITVFEGEEFSAPLADVAGELPAPASAPRFTPEELKTLSELCAQNIIASVTGATPTSYFPGVPDGSVQGVVIALHGPQGDEWLNAKKVSLRPSVPLQTTCFNLCQQLGQALVQLGARAEHLPAISLRLLVLWDAAMHGTAEKSDLRGFDAKSRAWGVGEGNRTALGFDPAAEPEKLLEETMLAAKVRNRAAALVYSLAAASNVQRMVVSDAQRAQPGAERRPAALAGTFYPADPAELSKLVEECLAGAPKKKTRWQAVMTPHAGLTYSGKVAGEVFGQTKLPERIVILSPKHTPNGVDWAVAPHAVWEVPGGELAGDPELAAAMAAAIPGLEVDAAAFAAEHGIEVQLPFLAQLAPQAKLTAIALSGATLEECRRIAAGLAEVLGERRESTLLVISSDMNHFATDEENRRLDAVALEALERLDAEHLYNTIHERQITMCGVVPATIVLETLRIWGQLAGAKRAGYATSADVSGDKSRVVGYAGMLIGKG